MPKIYMDGIKQRDIPYYKKFLSQKGIDNVLILPSNKYDGEYTLIYKIKGEQNYELNLVRNRR